MINAVLFLVALLFPLATLAHLVDEDGRQHPADFFAQKNVPGIDDFSSSGNLYCGRAGVDATAQVTLQKDLLLTAQHFFFNPETQQLKKNLELCFFAPSVGKFKGQRFRLRLDTLRFYSGHPRGEKGFAFKKEFSRDLALVRLDLSNHPSVELQPYGVANLLYPSQAPAYLLSAVDGGPKTTYDFSPALQKCRVRDFSAELLWTDCDIQNRGPSGAALLTETPSGLAVTGILVGFYGSKPGPYKKNANSTVFVAMTSMVQDWISAYIAEIH